MQTQILRRKCDAVDCHVIHDFDLQNITPDVEKLMNNWFTIIREVFTNGQAVPVVKHACSYTCAQLVLKTGLKPAQAIQTDGKDPN